MKTPFYRPELLDRLAEHRLLLMSRPVTTAIVFRSGEQGRVNMSWWIIIENIVFYAALYVLIWNAWFLTVNRGIPNIKTAPAIRKRIIEQIRQDMACKDKSSYTIIDLGAGNGDFTRQMARELPEANVIGIEISRLAYFRACFMKKRSGLKNLAYRNENFHDSEKLKEADAVNMFLLGTLMRQIRETLEKKLQPGTLVCSNKFPVGGQWIPEEIIDVPTLYPHQKRLFIYRV